MPSLILPSASSAPRSSREEAELTSSAPSGDAANAPRLLAGKDLLLRWSTFLALAAGGSLLDLWTKHAIFAWRGYGQPERNVWWLIEGFVGIETTLNHGALFGMGQGQTALFAGLSIAAAIGILIWVFFGGAVRDWFLTVALGCVLAGIIGNLYDRLGLWGGIADDGSPIYAVRDWILFCYKSYTWPNFNIADALLVCGAGILVVHAWLYGETTSKPSVKASGASQPAKN